MISLFIFIIYDRYVFYRIKEEVIEESVSNSLIFLYLNKIEIVNRLSDLNGKNSFSFFETKKLYF